MQFASRLCMPFWGLGGHWMSASGVAGWRGKTQCPVMIPVDAAGADALFDAFAALPGLRTERMLAELADDKTLSVVIWERRSMRPASTLLH